VGRAIFIEQDEKYKLFVEPDTKAFIMLVALLSFFFTIGFATAILSSNEPKKTHFELRRLFSNVFQLLNPQSVKSLLSDVATEDSLPSGNLLTK
jgi:hypothetical protein